MPRGVQYLNGYFPKFEYFAVFGSMDRKAGNSARAENNWGPGLFCKVKVPAYEIRMKVGLEDVFDLCVPFFRQFQIHINIPQRIDNRHFTIAFDIVGGLAQTTGI